MRHLSDHGFAFLALERREDQALIGGAGLSWTEEDVPGGPAVEIGRILARRFWRRGYASEAGRAWLAHGWSAGLDQIVGYTSEINRPSRELMEALGMTRDPADDFADPTVPQASLLSPKCFTAPAGPVETSSPKPLRSRTMRRRRPEKSAFHPVRSSGILRRALA